MFVAGVVTKRRGFSSVLILSKKKTGQHRTLYQDPQRLGQSHYNEDMVVINYMDIPKYTLIKFGGSWACPFRFENQLIRISKIWQAWANLYIPDQHPT